MSYTSHGDLLGGGNGKVLTKESQLRSRSMRNGPTSATNNVFYESSNRVHKGDYVSNSLFFKILGVILQRLNREVQLSSFMKKQSNLTILSPILALDNKWLI